MRMEPNSAGTSARREYERRRDARERRIRHRFGPVASIVLALTEEPASTKAWATGAEGEKLVARNLAVLEPLGVAVLHDRQIPGSKANIDHLVVTSTGVWLVDTKKHKGKIDVSHRWLRVGGRDRTSLVDGVERQCNVVHEQLDRAVPVRGALCFVNANFAWIRHKRVRDIEVCGPGQLIKKLAAQHQIGGPLDVTQVTVQLNSRFARA